MCRQRKNCAMDVPPEDELGEGSAARRRPGRRKCRQAEKLSPSRRFRTYAGSQTVRLPVPQLTSPRNRLTIGHNSRLCPSQRSSNQVHMIEGRYLIGTATYGKCRHLWRPSEDGYRGRQVMSIPVMRVRLT